MKNFFIALSVFFLSCSSSNNPTSPEVFEHPLLGTWATEEVLIIEQESNRSIFRMTATEAYQIGANDAWEVIEGMDGFGSMTITFNSNLSGSMLEAGESSPFTWSVSGTSLTINDSEGPIQLSFSISNGKLIVTQVEENFDGEGTDVIIQQTLSPVSN